MQCLINHENTVCTMLHKRVMQLKQLSCAARRKERPNERFARHVFLNSAPACGRIFCFAFPHLLVICPNLESQDIS